MFIAGEQERPLETGRLPDEAAISIVTVAELNLAVHMAESESIRSKRLQILGALRATHVALPVD